MKYQGTVKWFSNKKGFGFIAPTSENAPTKEEIFVHQTAIVTDGAYRTLKENATVQFEVESEAGTGKLKAVRVTNADGTPVVPPVRERRRRNNKPTSGDEAEESKENAGLAMTAPPATSSGDERKEDKTKKAGGRLRKPRKNGKAGGDKVETTAKPVAGTVSKEPPFHDALKDSVKKAMQDKGFELGKRTTVDVAAGDARIKLGQGGYAGCALASAKIGEGTYACDAQGKVTFSWERCLECKNGAWKPGDEKQLVPSIQLTDATVVPVKPDETPESLWGKDTPDPKDAFDAHGFLMRRVVLTRPPRRNHAGGKKN